MPSPLWLEVLTPIASAAITAFGALALERRRERWRRAEERRRAEEERRRQQLESFYDRMRTYLDAAWNGFVNQCRVRDRLLTLLEQNHDITPFARYEYPELISALHPAMNEEERSLFGFIRGITETTLAKYNALMVELLDTYPHFYADVSEMGQLHDHLNFWFGKYRATLKQRDDVCLVYVGVQDEKPFPTGVDQIVERKIRELRESMAAPRAP